MAVTIHRLSESLLKRIAAGEVVERPASAAKELLENALDANAKNVTLAVAGGGVDLIQVTDDGCGMGEEDAILCVERHATSKISSEEDLDAIRTLGFRGEALAAIGSVARLTITTRMVSDDDATLVFVEDSQIREVMKTASLPGTTISVKDLFYNVPARRKYLKGPAAELKHVIAAFRRAALGNPEVGFKLVIDGKTSFDLRPGSLEERVEGVMGESFRSEWIVVSRHAGTFEIHGFTSALNRNRKSRDEQFFFLNRRPISSKVLTHAVYSAYGILDGHPSFAIYLEMDPARFDANVHPAKTEVRFVDERFIHDSLYRAVKDGLFAPAHVPKFQLVQGRKVASGSAGFSPSSTQLALEIQRPLLGSGAERTDRDVPSLWQIHNRYILSQIKSGLTIIDQHVAHERILYERALRFRETRDAASQQLLFPQTVTLSVQDYLTLTDMMPTLVKIGFDIKEFGKNTVVIEAVPMEIKTGQEAQVLTEMIDAFREYSDETNDAWDAVAKSFACKSAIKSGDKLSQQEMASLIDQLFATNEPYLCPHGRPIVVNLSLEEIDKRFGR